MGLLPSLYKKMYEIIFCEPLFPVEQSLRSETIRFINIKLQNCIGEEVVSVEIETICPLCGTKCLPFSPCPRCGNQNTVDIYTFTEEEVSV